MRHTKSDCSAWDIFISGSGLQCGNCGVTDYQGTAELYNWCIVSKEGLFWSNTYGWGNYFCASLFSKREKETYHLPIGGEWKEIKPLDK